MSKPSIPPKHNNTHKIIIQNNTIYKRDKSLSDITIYSTGKSSIITNVDNLCKNNGIDHSTITSFNTNHNEIQSQQTNQ